MNLTQIKAQMGLLQEQQSQVGQRRQQEAETALLEGLAAFEQALEGELSQPEVLKYACRRLIEAMRLNHRDERPCLALAFLFLSIEDIEAAGDYLMLARQLDYENPLALALDQMLRAIRQGETPAAEAFTEEEIDYDELYQQVLNQIEKQLAWLAGQVPPQVSLQKERIRLYEQIVQRLHTQQSNLQQQIEQVDTEIETGELIQQLKQLESRLLDYRAALQQSQRLSELEAGLLAAEVELQALMKRPEALAAELEAVYDRCDVFADELEALGVEEMKSRGLGVGSVLESYERYVALAQTAGDYLDDI